MGNGIIINLNSNAMRIYLDEGFHKRNKSPQQIEISSIITGDIEFKRIGMLSRTVIIHYDEVHSDYDGFILKEVVNYIGIISLN